ncbi:hypothetical protein D3C78_959820 [compost metagenome]
MRRVYPVIFFLYMFMFLLGGCSIEGDSSPIPSNKQSVLINDEPVSEISKEVTEGDFVYRLVTEKADYAKGDEIIIYAELEYIGDQSSIEIYHAMSPFSFPIKELTRGYDIGYMMNQPLLTTELKKNEPLREYYAGGGGYGSQDKKEYIAFMKEFNENGFPTGEYVVYGMTDFYIIDDATGQQEVDYKLNAEISFEVKE